MSAPDPIFTHHALIATVRGKRLCESELWFTSGDAMRAAMDRLSAAMVAEQSGSPLWLDDATHSHLMIPAEVFNVIAGPIGVDSSVAGALWERRCEDAVERALAGHKPATLHTLKPKGRPS